MIRPVKQASLEHQLLDDATKLTIFIGIKFELCSDLLRFAGTIFGRYDQSHQAIGQFMLRFP